jgi:hypothetical protein
MHQRRGVAPDGSVLLLVERTILRLLLDNLTRQVRAVQHRDELGGMRRTRRQSPMPG